MSPHDAARAASSVIDYSLMTRLRLLYARASPKSRCSLSPLAVSFSSTSAARPSHRFHGHCDDPPALVIPLRASGRVGWASTCADLHALMVQGLPLDAESFRMCMSTCMKGSRWDLALEVFWLMQASHVQINIFALNIALNACARSQQWEDSLELFGLSHWYRINATSTTFNTLINACGRGHSWQMALEVLELI